MPTSILYTLRPYAVATVFVLAAFVVTGWLHSVTFTGTVFLLFFGAILGTAWFSGFFPTLYATLLAALLCWFYFLDHLDSRAIETWDSVLRLAIFILEGSLIGAMSDFLRRSQARNKEALADLKSQDEALLRANSELEMRVDQRTAALQAANEALHESERRFHAIFHNSFQFTGLMTTTGILLEVNQSMLEFSHLEREAVVGKFIWETLWFGSQDDTRRQAVQQAIARAATGEFIRYEFETVGRSGRTITIDFSIKPVRDDNGQVRLLIPEGRDMSERKAAYDKLRRSEERFQKIFHASPVAMSITTMAEGHFIDANEALCSLYGFHRDEIIGKTGLELGMWVEGADRGAIVEALKAQGFLHSFEAQVRTKSGEVRDVLSSLEVVDLDDTPTLLGISYDVTDRKRTEDALQNSHARMGEWVAELEQRNEEMSVLNEMNDLLQAARDEADAYDVIVRYIAQLFPQEAGALYITRASRNLVERVAVWGNQAPEAIFIEPGDCWGMRRGRIHTSGNGYTTPPCRHALQTSDGTISTLCIPLIAFGETLGLLHFVMDLERDSNLPSARYREPLVRALADQIGLAIANLKLRENLRFQAIRDPLTGLYNRRFMQETLQHEVQRARLSGASVGVVMIDVDHFKRFNDTFGHLAGDFVLKSIGAHLQEQGEELKLACRYGGEEFALILPAMTVEQVVARAEQLRHHIKNLSLQHGKNSLGKVTISVGVGMYPRDGGEPESLIHAADRALYTAKQAGRDRVVAHG